MTVLGTLTLPGVARSIAHARAFVRDLLPAGHPLAYEVMLVTSELATNTIEHTRTDQGGRFTTTLRLTRDALRLEIADDGAHGERPRLMTHAECREHGRGIALVAETAVRWGYAEDGPRTTVWAEFPSTPELRPMADHATAPLGG